MPNNTVSSSKSLSPTLFVFLIVPFLLLIFLLNAAGSGQAIADSEQIKVHKVEVFPVELQHSYERQMRAVGRAEPSKQANVGFERAGTVAVAYVDEGVFVEQGTLLAELDTQRLDAQMMEVDATVARAQADARLAEISAGRIAKLVQDKLESPQRLDEAREREVAAKALVQQVVASKERLLVELAKSKIVAPFSGTVLSRPVDPGSVVAQGQPVFVMQQDSVTEVRIALGTDQAFNMKVGDVYPLLAQFNNKHIEANVKSIARARNVNTRTIDIIFALGDGHTVLPGDLLTLSIPQTVKESGMWVPKSALTSGVRGLWTVYTVQDKGADQKIIPKSVTVLYNNATHAYVSGALQHGDLVVVEGSHRLVPGQIVAASLTPVQQLAKR